MSPAIKIECLREPELLFGRRMTGVEPRRIMARAGAVDHGNGEELSVGLVGPAEDIAIASAWLPRLNKLGTAREKSARRYRDWPGAPKALGVTFVVDERFVRPIDPDRLALALSRISPSDKFDELLELFDARLQGLFGDVRPDCILVCCQIKLRTCGSAIRACPCPSVTPLNVCSARKNRNRWCCSSRRQRS
jgi:hypothetical protein